MTTRTLMTQSMHTKVGSRLVLVYYLNVYMIREESLPCRE